jgi:hypothetical protein
MILQRILAEGGFTIKLKFNQRMLLLSRNDARLLDSVSRKRLTAKAAVDIMDLISL